MAKDKWGSVFAAHPEVNEIYIGTNADGIEQPFLERVHAGNFAGSKGKLETVTRPTEKKEAEPRAKKAAEGAE